MMPVRSAIDALEERPASPTAADRAALYLLNDTERLDSLLRRTNPATMTGAEREVAARLAMAIQESSATLAALVRRGRPAVPSQPGPPGRPGRRRGRVATRASRGYRAVAGLLERAASGAIVAESAFAEYLATRPGPAAVRETLWYLSAASRLWYAADILRTMPTGGPGGPRWDTLAPLAHALEDTADRSASRLHGRPAQPTPPDGRPQPGEPAPPPGYPENSLEGWIDDLTRQLTPDDGAVTGPEDARE
jgi:hypothetical protein